MYKHCKIKDAVCAFCTYYPIDEDDGIPVCGLLKGQLYEIKVSAVKECPLIKLQAKKKRGKR